MKSAPTKVTKSFQNGTFNMYVDNFKVLCNKCNSPATIKVESWGNGRSWGQMIKFKCCKCSN